MQGDITQAITPCQNNRGDISPLPHLCLMIQKQTSAVLFRTGSFDVKGMVTESLGNTKIVLSLATFKVDHMFVSKHNWLKSTKEYFLMTMVGIPTLNT